MTDVASVESEVTTLVAGSGSVVTESTVAVSAAVKSVVVGSVAIEAVAAGSVVAGSAAVELLAGMYGSEKYIQLPVISAVIIVVLEPSLVCRRSNFCTSEDDTSAGVDESTGLGNVEEMGPEAKRPKIETISRLSEPQVVFLPPRNDCKFNATGAKTAGLIP